MARGMEFATQPYDVPRRETVQTNTMFGAPTYRWLPAKSKLRADYYAFVTAAKSIPETLQELEIHVPA